MAVTTAAAILIGTGLMATAGGVQAYQGQQNLENARRARNAQQGLEMQRRNELAAEAAARQAAADKAATSGQRVGQRSSMLGSLGFGSGNTQQGLGAGTLFGN